MIQAIQVLRFHLLELEKVSNQGGNPLGNQVTKVTFNVLRHADVGTHEFLVIKINRRFHWLPLHAAR